VVRDDDKSSHHPNDDMDFQESRHGDDDIEHVEVDVYENDYYTQESDYDIMAPMMDIPAGNDDSKYQDVKMPKALLRVSKASCLKPMIPQGIATSCSLTTICTATWCQHIAFNDAQLSETPIRSPPICNRHVLLYRRTCPQGH